MIIKDSVRTAEIVGDVQSNTVSVDISNVDFITQLLTTHLYSKPLDSFLREIVSNAWDSHIESNNEDPILLELGTNTEDKHYIRIQDFGVGLSPERFDTIYKMIGSSTKRADNSQIGGFGIGRFSALAYTGSVYITSNYLGIKYKYLMYKDGHTINIDKIFETPTTDHNGLEVMVYLEPNDDIYDVGTAIKSQLIYFDNLYLNCDRYKHYSSTTLAEDFNNLKIKKYKTFSVNSQYTSNHPTILLGKIQYPLNYNINYDTIFDLRRTCPISINFEIGELPTTPNREEIQYTRDAIKKIGEKLDEVALELEEIAESQSVKDFTNLNDYIAYRKSDTHYITLLDNPDGRSVNISVPKENVDVTYNGKMYDYNLIRMWDHIMDGGNYNNPLKIKSNHVSFKISDNRMMIKNPLKWDISLASLINRYIPDTGNSVLPRSVYIANRGNLNAASKDYLRENALDDTIFLKESLTWKSVMKDIIKVIKYPISDGYGRQRNFTWDKKQFKVIANFLLEEFSKITKFTNEDVPQVYLDDRAKRTKSTNYVSVDAINWSEEVNLFILRERETYTSNLRVTADSNRYSMDTIKKIWTGFPVIYSYKDDIRLRRLFWTFHNINHYYGTATKKHPYSKYRFVEIAPTKIDKLKQFHNFINIDDFMNVKYKKLREIGTAKYLQDNFDYVNELAYNKHVLSRICPELSTVSTKINNYIGQNLPRHYEMNETLTQEIYQMCEDHDYFDEEMRGYVNKHKKLLENSKFITILANGSILPDRMINFTVDYALKNKLFKPDLAAVQKLRKETIFNNPVKEEEK